MSQTPHEWKYLERRPGSSYKQLCINGKRIWAWTLYCEFMSAKEPRTPEQLAEDWGVPLEAVQEAIAYCQSAPPELARTIARMAPPIAAANGTRRLFMLFPARPNGPPQNPCSSAHEKRRNGGLPEIRRRSKALYSPISPINPRYRVAR